MADGPAMVSTDRADRVADALAEREADVLLVTDLVNVRWLTGFTGSNAAAVVGREGSRRFVTDFRYLTQSAEEVDPAWEREIAVDLLAGVVKGLPGSGELRVAFDDAHMSVKDHGRLAGMLRAGIELVPGGGAIETLRAVKDADELEAIRAAARLADDALTEVLGRGLVGRTEREVALDLEFTMRRMGAQAASFPPIVAAAEHGALPHATPREVPIPAGTLVVVDWGAQLDGYASDCTRTYATGDIDPRDGQVYQLVLQAQEAALAAVRPGPRAARSTPSRARSSTPPGTPSTSATGWATAWGSTCTRGRGCPSRGRQRWRPGWSSPSSPGSMCPAPWACASRTSSSSPTTGPRSCPRCPRSFSSSSDRFPVRRLKIADGRPTKGP